jgi:hypothetical protein
MEVLRNGGQTATYRWGQTLEEVTVHLPLAAGVRARALSVDIRRAQLRVALKAGGTPLLDGRLMQPVRCDECTWMVEDGTLVLQLAKDNKRAANTGPSTEWWLGLFEGEDTSDPRAVSVEDYASASQLPPEQLAQLSKERATQGAAEEHHVAERSRAARAEAALPADSSIRGTLESLRAKFPDIPVEYNGEGEDDGGFSAALAGEQGV